MTWNDREDFEQSRADHQYEVEMLEPLDDLHAESIEARTMIRREFAAARRRVAAWTPEPFPVAADSVIALAERVELPLEPWQCNIVRAVYLDEVDRFRPWFRS